MVNRVVRLNESAKAAARAQHVRAHMNIRLITRALRTVHRLQQLDHDARSDSHVLVELYLEALRQCNDALVEALLRHLHSRAHQ